LHPGPALFFSFCRFVIARVWLAKIFDLEVVLQLFDLDPNVKWGPVFEEVWLYRAGLDLELTADGAERACRAQRWPGTRSSPRDEVRHSRADRPLTPTNPAD
jgi:hypothetical protein